MTSGDILFLCSGNYYRSRHAEIYFNWLAARESASVTAISRGLALSDVNVGAISQHTLERLRVLDIECPTRTRLPLWLSEEDLAAARHVIALKTAEHQPMLAARFPTWLSRVEFWDIDDLDCAGPATALPQIERAVAGLLERIRELAA